MSCKFKIGDIIMDLVAIKGDIGVVYKIKKNINYNLIFADWKSDPNMKCYLEDRPDYIRKLTQKEIDEMMVDEL